MSTRSVLTASISAESYASWESFAAEHGVSMTALVEALGLALGSGLPPRLTAEVVTVARQVTAERRSRRSGSQRQR